MNQKSIFIILLLLSIISCSPSNSNQELSNSAEKKKPSVSIEIDKEFKNGDIIFQTSKSSQSIAIQKATKSRYSHMGIIFENNSELYVYEAVQPVKFTPLREWINRGVDKHYVVKRLKDHRELLTEGNILAMQQTGKKFKGKDYDLLFEWNDDKIYCSELVWKIYKESLGIEIGELQKIKEFDLTDSSVKLKMKERYGDIIPQEELVISPESMFTSNKLITVIEN